MANSKTGNMKLQNKKSGIIDLKIPNPTAGNKKIW